MHQRRGDATWVEVPETLQLAFDLMKQPGFHPELVELLEIELSMARTLGAPPAPAMQTWHWVLITVAVALVGVSALRQVCC